MPTTADAAVVAPSGRALGRITVPGDKSISHRYAMLAALAEGRSTIAGYSGGADCAATLACIQALGARVERAGTTVQITGTGYDLAPSAEPLYAANSGTTMRLMAGIVASHAFRTVIGGDGSLTRRPMRRIIDPLERMGAHIGSQDGRPPLVIDGARLRGITYAPQVPSAQVKSGVLLAGLRAEGMTTVEESTPTRDHTERALETFAARVERSANAVTIEGGQLLRAKTVTVPGDLSGAAFWSVLAAGTAGGDVTIEQVGLNPTRAAVLAILRRAGARVTSDGDDPSAAEPAGTLRVEYGEWRSFEIDPVEVPGVIDEIPALAALAAMMPAGRSLVVRGARELRVKESDRISALASGFAAMGSDIEEYEDGFRLTARPLAGAVVDAAHDHRLAMAFAIAATKASSPVTIRGASVVDVSYPGFFDTLARLTRDEPRPERSASE
jgi:3-phosphoshikimate 1-carboxyvinyltransferase